ncbi:MAG: OsmC family protein [Clostridia bacterium]|nr:OsmC family protein [Clostridia bacterium]
MEAKVSWKNKACFEAEVGSGHKILMDGAPEFGGENKGARPTELVLSGLGGCSGIDIVNILIKMRQEITKFTAHIDGTRAEDHPKRFTRIHVHYELEGPNIDPEKVKKAVQLSLEKYCSVALSLNAEITYSYEVNGIKYNAN